MFCLNGVVLSIIESSSLRDIRSFRECLGALDRFHLAGLDGPHFAQSYKT